MARYEMAPAAFTLTTPPLRARFRGTHPHTGKPFDVVVVPFDRCAVWPRDGVVRVRLEGDEEAVRLDSYMVVPMARLEVIS